MELSYHEIVDHLLTAAAKKHQVDPDVLKAIAWTESDWRQTKDTGEPVIGKDGELGMMQIHPHQLREKRKQQGRSIEEIDKEIERVKKDQAHNIEVGAEWAEDSLKYAKDKIRWEDYKRKGKTREEYEDLLKTGTYSVYNGGPGKAQRSIPPDDPEKRKSWKQHEYDVKYREFLEKRPWEGKIKEEREYYGQWE